MIFLQTSPRNPWTILPCGSIQHKDVLPSPAQPQLVCPTWALSLRPPAQHVLFTNIIPLAPQQPGAARSALYSRHFADQKAEAGKGQQGKDTCREKRALGGSGECSPPTQFVCLSRGGKRGSATGPPAPTLKPDLAAQSIGCIPDPGHRLGPPPVLPSEGATSTVWGRPCFRVDSDGRSSWLVFVMTALNVCISLHML